jgi:hypothetical protein
MPAFVQPISKTAGRDVDGLHYAAIIAELKAQIADMREQRDAWREIATAYLDITEANARKARAVLAWRPQGHHAGTGR